MKQTDLRFLIAFIFPFFLACSTDPVPATLETKYDHGVLIINEGNFLSGDGEITHYDPITETLTPNLFQTINGFILAAYIEQVRIHGEEAFIVDSNQGAAKVVVVNKATFEEVGRVEGLEIPRDVAVAENTLFIADWGNYDDQGNYTNPASFVAVADIQGGEIREKISVSSRPQAIIQFEGSIYVACQASKEIIKINPSSLEITDRMLIDASPSEFVISEGKLMLFGTVDQKLFLGEINPADLATSPKVYDIPNANRLVLDGSGEAWVLTSSYAADYSYTDNAVLNFSLSGAESINTVYEARNLKGIGLDRASNQIYIADDNGIQGNGSVIITDLQGKEINKLEVGRVPSKFYFY
jgi:hypothetical protein